MPDNTLATAVDTHGLLVTLERDADPAGNVHGLHLVMSGRTAAFDPADEVQRAGLVALHDALGAALAERGSTAQHGPWQVARIDVDTDADGTLRGPGSIDLPDEQVVADNVIMVAGVQWRIIGASRYARVIYVRPQGDR